MPAQVVLQAHELIGTEVVAVAAHERDQATMFGTHRIDTAPAGEETLANQADHVEAVGPDLALNRGLHHSAFTKGFTLLTIRDWMPQLRCSKGLLRTSTTRLEDYLNQ